MHTIVLGAGIIGVATAWYLLEEGHDVTVVERQPEAALETSFANGAQISVCFCEPWANAGAPLKVAKWMLQDDSPLLFRHGDATYLVYDLGGGTFDVSIIQRRFGVGYKLEARPKS